MVLGLILGAAPAMASEALRYDQKISKRVLQHIHTMMPYTAFDVSAADLNQDHIREYIIRSPKGCVEECQFRIMADKGSQMIRLGNIKARVLMLASTSTLGVRDIKAFQNEHNDYDFTLYRWDADQSRYTMTPKGSAP